MDDLGLNEHAVLKDLAGEIILSRRPFYSLRPDVVALKAFLTDASLHRIDRNVDIATGQTRTDSGTAISPTMAAMCLDDYARTAVFLRGIYAAITDRKKQIPQRPVNVLYAGCGPVAALAVPVMALLTRADAVFTLIDIHSESISSARAVIDAFGLSDRVNAFEIDDAAKYKIDPRDPPDIILTETLRATLKAEPQVAITRNLVSQAQGATLIPEEIRVELKLVDAAREFDIDGTGLNRDRIDVGAAFVVNKEAVAAWQHVATPYLDGATLTLPSDAAPKYRARLFTTIRVYGDHVLEDYNSGITVPRPLDPLSEPRPGAQIRFWYELGSDPRLAFEIS